jgi:peroxiredoxin
MPIPDDLRRAFDRADALETSLNEKLAAYTEAARKAIPGILDAYDKFVARLQGSGAGAEAPSAGDEMPGFLLPDEQGRLVSLDELTRSGPVVISFNRGHWCPYCRLELRALARAYPRLAAAGAQVVSILPETAEFSQRLRDANKLPFPVLSDLDHGYALTVGLTVWIGDELERRYRAANIDLGLYQASDGWFLPIPATYIVDQNRRVKARFVDPDFRKRLPIEEIVAALTELRADREPNAV